MPPSAEDYLKQAEDILRWADDCDAVAKQFRARAADLVKLANLASATVPQQQQQQQVQPKAPKDG
jgi:hypothetical protein